jgi:hypothetical protein
MAVRSLLESAIRASIVERATRLTPTSTARWGSMDAPRMMRHCVEALRGSLGDVHHESVGKRFFHTWLVKRLVFRVLPFPRNAPTVPELRVAQDVELQPEVDCFAELVGRYAALPAADRRVEHPLFGPLTQAEWAELEYRHLDHHLRQFGV